MSIYYEDGLVTLHHGDCLDTMAEMPEASVDTVLTDRVRLRLPRRGPTPVHRVAWVDTLGYQTQDHDTPAQATTHEAHLKARGIRQVIAYTVGSYERNPA